MTVPAVGFSGPTWAQLPGNGAATVFSFPFLITAATDLVVGYITAGVYSSQFAYTVSGVGNVGGGQITFTTAPPTGTTVDIRSQIPETQPTNFANLGAYYPENTTNAADRMTRLVTDLYRLTYLFGIHGPDQENVPWTTLPNAAARANTGLIFDANGLPTVGAIPSTVFTQALFNAFLSLSTFFPAVGAESGLTIVNGLLPPGTVDRYGMNANPGVTDLSVAIQAALGLTASGYPMRFLAGAYLCLTPPTTPTIPPNVMVPIDVGGVGMGTIVYCGTTGTGGLFSVTSGMRIHDMQIVSVAGTTNNGIVVQSAGGVQPIGWTIERVYSRMQGVGFLLSNTNSGVIRDCWHWLDNASTLPVGITPAGINVSHGIYATGGFVNDVSVYDFKGAGSVNYSPGQRWIKNDCTNSLNFRIRGGLAVNESPANSHQMLELGSNGGGSHIYGAEVIGVYHQQGFLGFNNCNESTVMNCTDGGGADASGVSLTFQLNSVANSVISNSIIGSLNFDSGSNSNSMIGGTYGGLVDNAAIPNFYAPGFNRNAGPSGWGTPTGAAVVANFSGSAATLVNCSNAIAELIIVLKKAGFIAA